MTLFQSVKRTIEKKTVDVFTLVKTEINAVSQELSIKGKALTHQQPKFAGASHRVRALKRRVEKIMTVSSFHIFNHLPKHLSVHIHAADLSHTLQNREAL